MKKRENWFFLSVIPFSNYKAFNQIIYFRIFFYVTSLNMSLQSRNCLENRIWGQNIFFTYNQYQLLITVKKVNESR